MHRGAYQHHDMYLIVTLVFSRNKQVHEIAYASSEGLDEPGHLREIATGLTANCPHTYRRNVDEGACLNLG